MKRILLLPLSALLLGLAASPASADDGGPRAEMLKGAPPSERDYVKSPDHFNDGARTSAQLAEGPLTSDPSGFGITAPRNEGVADSSAMTRAERTDGSGATSVAAPWERSIHRGQMANGLMVD